MSSSSNAPDNAAASPAPAVPASTASPSGESDTQSQPSPQSAATVPAPPQAAARPAIAKPVAVKPVAIQAVSVKASAAAGLPATARITGVAGGAKLAAVPSVKSATPLAAQSKPMAKPRSVPINKPITIRPVVALARIRGRHRLLIASFALVVLLPILIAAAYLWGKAADQYASTVGFSVRREEASAAIDMLGGLAGLSKSSSSDTDILYEYLRSQKLVANMDAKLNLRAIWSKPQGDPIFTLSLIHISEPTRPY